MRLRTHGLALLVAALAVVPPAKAAAEPIATDNPAISVVQPHVATTDPTHVVVVSRALELTAITANVSIESVSHVLNHRAPRTPIAPPLSMSLAALGAIAGTVRAKVRCSSKTKNEGFDGTAFRFDAVYSNDPNSENKSFTDATPSLSLNMTISDGKPAAEQFEEGKEYYLDFTPAE